jgi:hypothetical protein
MTKLGSITEPNLAALLQAWRDEVFATLNCHQLGTIVSFNAETQSAQVTLNVLRVFGNQTRSYPMLVDVPVFVPAGGTAALTLPVTTGDTCLVLFNDRDMDNWFDSGATAAPNSPRCHSLADGLAIVGFRSKRNPIADYDPDNVVLRNGAGKVIVRDQESTLDLDEKIGLSNADGSLLATLNLVVTALTALNAKTGPSAAVQITAAQVAITALLK